MTRHQIRERAFQTLFALNANKEGDKQAIFDQLLGDEGEEQVTVPTYLNVLVDGVLEHQSDLDDLITKYLSEVGQSIESQNGFSDSSTSFF